MRERNSSSCGFRRGNLLDSTRELNLHGTKLKQEGDEERKKEYKDKRKGKEKRTKEAKDDNNVSEVACNRNMYCRIKDPRKVATVPMPIDGTPCGLNKVCWNSKCLSY
ncbi:hypothetical protein PV327_002931 [Microctonus hyperodae]|uniref:Uncharacterized protein n=1 Tax=Microctonus hyperodae TaxID=165561 RepID=A0AA39L0D2_MICHY|nr:hypothetical protein PV327_002931 [Microctonus hyperodae]